jgi:hypothetical protein
MSRVSHAHRMARASPLAPMTGQFESGMCKQAEVKVSLTVSVHNTISLLPDCQNAVSQFRDPNQHSLKVFSGRPIPKELLSSNGWVCGSDGLLFWVPEDCRHGLTCRAIMTISDTGRHRCVRIDFTRFQYGTSWTNIRGNSSQ